MTADNKKVWFKARRRGWGLTPVLWQGWLVLVGTLSIGIAPFIWANVEHDKAVKACDLLMANTKVLCFVSNKRLVEAAFWLVGWIIVLIVIAYKKGEKPSWRWGK